MDYLTILTIVILAIIFFINNIIKQNSRYKGSTFEYKIYKKLIKLIRADLVLKNIYIQRKNERLTEIDIIAVHNTGVYIIECKNYSGWIFGDSTKKKWYQTHKSGQKYEFYNPIFQNEIHINAVKNLINKNLPFYSIIVFSSECALQSIQINQPNTFVIYDSQFINFMNKLLSNNNIIDDNDVNTIINALKSNCNTEQNYHMQHMTEIYEGTTKCPYCNGNLVERINKKTNNKFYGCSNYPQCKYTTSKIREII